MLNYILCLLLTDTPFVPNTWKVKLFYSNILLDRYNIF